MTLFNKFRSQQSHKEEKKFFTDNHFQNILRLSDVYQILFSPQVKLCTIITDKHAIDQFPHKLPNDFRLRVLGNSEI